MSLNKTEQAKFKEFVGRFLTHVGDGPKRFASINSIYQRLEAFYKAEGLEMPGCLTGHGYSGNYRNLIDELELLGILINKRKESGSDRSPQTCTAAGYIIGPSIQNVLNRNYVRSNDARAFLSLKDLTGFLRKVMGKNEFNLVYNVNVETGGTTPGFSTQLSHQGFSTVDDKDGRPGLAGWKAKPRTKNITEPDKDEPKPSFRVIQDDARRLLVIRILDVLRHGSPVRSWNYKDIAEKVELMEKLYPAGVKFEPMQIRRELQELANLGLVIQEDSGRILTSEPRFHYRLSSDANTKWYWRW